MRALPAGRPLAGHNGGRTAQVGKVGSYGPGRQDGRSAAAAAAADRPPDGKWAEKKFLEETSAYHVLISMHFY